MDIEKSLDIIIKQDQREIRNYSTFAIGVIIAFILLLCFNFICGYIKDVAAALTNFLVLAVGFIPFQQIIKRRRRIIFFNTIVRPGISENDADKEANANYISEVIKDAIKN